MKKILFILIPIFLISIFQAYSQSKIDFIAYEPDSIMLKAKQEGKPIFLYATLKGCMPCKVLEYHTFGDTTLANFVRQYAIATKLNITDKDGKESYQKRMEIAKALGIGAYPTIIIFDKEGKEVKRGLGILTAKALIELIQGAF